MHPWRVLRYGVALAAVAAGGYAIWRYQPLAPRAPALQLGAVGRGDLTVKVTVAGGVVPRRKVLITPPYNGYIRKLYVRVGDQVKSGSPVVSIADSVGAADQDIFPLRSPISGVVVQVWREEGEYVSTTPIGNDKDATIVRVDDLSRLLVQANVAEIDVAKLKLGLPVVIRALAVPARTYHGKIVSITQAARETSGWDRTRVEFPMSVEVDDADKELKPGMSVVTDIIVQEAKGVLTLRHEFVQKTGGGYFVTLEGGAKRPIEVGLQNEEAFEVKAGVGEGDKVRQIDFLAAEGGG